MGQAFGWQWKKSTVKLSQDIKKQNYKSYANF